MVEHEITVSSRNWHELPTRGPVLRIEADNRVDIDIDPRGIGWARIARGDAEAVQIVVVTGDPS